MNNLIFLQVKSLAKVTNNLFVLYSYMSRNPLENLYLKYKQT